MAHTNGCPKGIDLILKRVSFGRGFSISCRKSFGHGCRSILVPKWDGYKRGTPNLHKSAVFWAFNWTAPSGGMQIHDTDGERAEFTVKSRQTDLKEGNLASYFAKIGEQPTNTKRDFYPRRRGLESTNPGISTQITVTCRDLPSLKLRGFPL